MPGFFLVGAIGAHGLAACLLHHLKIADDVFGLRAQRRILRKQRDRCRIVDSFRLELKLYPPVQAHLANLGGVTGSRPEGEPIQDMLNLLLRKQLASAR